MNLKCNSVLGPGAAIALVCSALLMGCVKLNPRAINSSKGPTLWSQNCGHCHNARSPNAYSDAQWEVVMLHMRVRANLTAAEHEQILAFLKSAH